MAKNLTYRVGKSSQLQNVTIDANFDALMHYSGGWKAGTYTPNEVVGYDGGLYVCKITTTTTPTTGSPEWDLIAFTPSSGLLYGAPANFAPGAAYTAIDNWPNAVSYGPFALPDAGTGIITLPKTGLYRITQQFVFQQGNSNKELAALLWLRSSVEGDFVTDAIQISDDKTDVRAVSAGFIISADAGETIQSGLSWVNQTMGTCTFQPCTFEAELVIA